MFFLILINIAFLQQRKGEFQPRKKPSSSVGPFSGEPWLFYRCPCAGLIEHVIGSLLHQVFGVVATPRQCSKKKTVRKQNGHSSGNPQIIEISGFCCCWYLDFLRGYLSGELKSSLVNLPSLAPPSLMSSTTQARRLASEDGFCATFIETKSRVNEKISGSFVFQVCLIYSYFRHLIPFIRDS